MFGMEIGQVKGLFFDTEKVLRATDKAERRVLSKFGAYVRRGARSSIRKRRAPSPPGTPPSSHTGVLKRFIFFAYEPERRTVVIGPARLNQKTGDAPPALEYGGQSRVVTGNRRRRRRVRTVTIRPRPFMRPALERERPKLPAMWKNSVR